MCHTLVLHDSLYICEVKVDKCRKINKISDSLNCLLQYLICLLECIRHCCATVYYLKKLIIWNDNKCINALFKSLYSRNSINHSLLCLKFEWFCNNTNCKYALILCYLCNNRSCTCTCSASHTTCDEYHISALYCCLKLLCTLLSGLLTDLRLRTCAESLCKLLSNLYKCRSLTKL